MKFFKHLPLVVLLALLLPPGVEAQSIKAYLKKADEAYNTRNYSTALAHYRTVLQEEPERIDVLYAAAESARRLRSYKLAERYYEMIPDAEKRGNYELTDFWLATVKKGMEKFDEASVLFSTFAEAHPENTKYYRKAQEEIENCDWALEVVQNPLRVEIQQLGENVNTYYADYAPFLVGDTLYYSSSAKVRLDKKKKPSKKKKKRKKRKKKKRKKKTNKRTEYTLVTKIFRADGENKGKAIRQNSRKSNTYTANMTMNTTRTRMYYSICEVDYDGSISCQLYYRDRSYSGGWERARPLPSAINVEGTKTTQPAVGIDLRTGKEVLFFSSDREGGKGMMDIWYCFVESPESFSLPQNLKNLNTADDEMSPFFDTHAQTLYFSSDGYQNLGGYDLYKTVKDKSTNEWSKPENLGYPINSSYDEMYYSFDTQSGRVFIASNRPGSLCASESKDCNLYDIYELVPNMNLVVSVFNEKDFSLQKGASLRLVDQVSGEEELIEMGEEEYYANLALSPGHDYDLIVKKEGFEETTTILSSKTFTDDDEAKKYVFMTPIDGYVFEEIEKKTIDDMPPVKTPKKYEPPIVQDPQELVADNSSSEQKEETGAPTTKIETTPKASPKTNYPPKKSPKTNYPPKKSSKTNYPPARNKVKGKPKTEIIATRKVIPPKKEIIATQKVESPSIDNSKTPRITTVDDYELMLVGTRSGFDVATGEFTAKRASKPKAPITQERAQISYVDEKVYSLNLPITVYFDNNYPRSSADMDAMNYTRAYNSFMRRKQDYVTKYPLGLRGFEKEIARKDINGFFADELQGGYFELMEFSENLLYHLKQGHTIELEIEGYASSLGNAVYNEQLTDRRIRSVMNHFASYASGALKPYIGKNLIIKKVPFGESRSSGNVSDDYKDKRSSVYSPGACLERRVTVTGYKKSGSGLSSK